MGHPATKNFEEWLRQSDFYHKLPLKPQWVFDCLEEHELVDVEEYVYEGFRVEKKRGRRSKTGQRYILTAVKSGSEDESENEEGGSEDEDEAEERVKHGGVKKKRKVEEKPAKHVKVKPEQQKVSVEKKQKKQKTAVKEEKMMKKASKAVHDEATIKTNSKGKAGIKGKGKEPVKTSSKAPDSVPQRGPPSPPPPTIVVEHSTGRHVYTKEDYDYCDEYIPILLARDPTMSNSTIAEKLHVKVSLSGMDNCDLGTESLTVDASPFRGFMDDRALCHDLAREASATETTGGDSEPQATRSSERRAVDRPRTSRHHSVLGQTTACCVGIHCEPHRTLRLRSCEPNQDNGRVLREWSRG